MKLIDVSVPLDATLPTYPSNTQFGLEGIKRIERGDTANLSSVHISAHTDTYVDTPRQFFADDAEAQALSLDLLIGPVQVVEVGGSAITADALAGAGLAAPAYCLPLRIVGSDGAPARVVLARS
jgi:arylformamidase